MLDGSRCPIHQSRSWLQWHHGLTWPSVAAWAQMSQWLRVATQSTNICMAPAVTWPSDSNQVSVSGSDPWSLYWPSWQPGPQTSTQTLTATEPHKSILLNGRKVRLFKRDRGLLASSAFYGEIRRQKQQRSQSHCKSGVSGSMVSRTWRTHFIGNGRVSLGRNYIYRILGKSLR